MVHNFIVMATKYTWQIILIITYAQFECLIFNEEDRTTVFLVVEPWIASITHQLR